MRFSFAWLRAAIAAIVLFTAAGAEAQQWLSDRQRAEGRGIRLGDFELHPGIGSEIGWVSNVFLADKANAESSAILRVSPHLYLSTLTRESEAPRRAAFRAGVSGALKHYFATTQGTDMSVGQDARLVLRPSGVFSFEIFDDYRRSIDPFVDASSGLAGAASGKAGKYDRDQLGVGTRLQLSTPGELLKAGVGYRFDYDYFEDKRTFQTNNNNSHTISADTSWEFLPKTALVWTGSVRLHSYLNKATPTLTLRNDSTNVNTSIGINGAITRRLSATATVGYSAGFFTDNRDYESVIAQVEGRWTIQENVLWSLGYDRTFSPAFQGNFSHSDRLKTRLQALAMGKLLIALRAELAFVAFGRDPIDPGADARKDTQLLTNLSGEYRFVDWLAMTAEAGYLRNFSNYYYSVLAVNGMGMIVSTGARNSAAYDQFSAWLGLRAFL